MPRILIFDDERSSAEALRRNLLVQTKEQSLDWDILLATRSDDDVDDAKFIRDGLDTIGAARNDDRPIDLVLTDLCMTDTSSGYGVLERAKEIDPTLMTILYTGRQGDLDRERAYKLNVYAIANRTDQGTIFSNELFHLARAALHFRDQHRSLCAVQRFADPDISTALARDPKSLAMAKQLVSIVFWDIRGFSKLSQRLIAHPNVLVDFIREYCEMARDVIKVHRGILDKFIGDGVMAIFGHPIKGIPDSCGAADALDAALEFNRRFDELAARKHHELKKHGDGKIELPRLGCGIHTSEVLVGYIGTERGEFTAFGHGVNVASRVVDVAKVDPIIVTENVRSWALETSRTSRYSFEAVDLKAEELFKNIPIDFPLYRVRAK